MGPRCGPVIGVMGAPGSGKTSAAAAFAELGAKTVALDTIGHELLSRPEVSEEIRRTFSSGVFRILDGEVSRRKLARVVFDDLGELERLNNILHPRMVERVRSAVERWRRKGPEEGESALVIEGALLLEMGLDELCDHVVLVRAPREARLERLAGSRGWDEPELDRRERAQRGDEGARARADAVIENASTLDGMRQSVRALWEEWK